MRRRQLLRSAVALPAAALLPAQSNKTAVHDKGLPAGPPLVPPGVDETPNTPVVPPDETAATLRRTFAPDQLAALAKLGDIIVPSFDGNPGAREADAAEFLDFLIGCSPQPRIDLYKNGLNTLERNSQERFGKSFTQLTLPEADEILAPLREPWSYSAASGDSFRAFLIAVKGDLIRATANSRPYIDAISQKRRPRNASDFYWYPIS